MVVIPSPIDKIVCVQEVLNVTDIIFDDNNHNVCIYLSSLNLVYTTIAYIV